MGNVFDQAPGPCIVGDRSTKLAADGSNRKKYGQHDRNRFRHPDDCRNIGVQAVMKQYRRQGDKQQVNRG